MVDKLKLESEFKFEIQKPEILKVFTDLNLFKKLLYDILLSINESLVIKKIECYQKKKEEIYFDTETKVLQKNFISIRLDIINNKLTIKIRLFKDKNLNIREAIEYVKNLSSLEVIDILQNPSNIFNHLEKDLQRIIIEKIDNKKLTIIAKIITNPRRIIRINIFNKNSYESILKMEFTIDRKIFEDMLSKERKEFSTLEIEFIEGNKKLFNEIIKRLVKRLELI